MTSKIEFEIPIKYTIKVIASSSELLEKELRKIVTTNVRADLVRDAKCLNACAGCKTADNKTYSYSYEAVVPLK